MKQAIVYSADRVDIVDSAIPSPGPDDVVIKVVVSGCNPKDWKIAEELGIFTNPGDDIAGIVHATGERVYEFKAGDRVAAYHRFLAPGGCYAEYAMAPQHMTVHIPNNLSFEEAATMPLAATTAVVAMYVYLKLPEPWHPLPTGQQLPFLVYGAATAIGAFAIKIARLCNIHPIIAVAGGSIGHIESMIDKGQGDAVIDYRLGHEGVVNGVKNALEATGVSPEQLNHAFECTGLNESRHCSIAAMAGSGSLATVMASKGETTDIFSQLPNIKITEVLAGIVHSEQQDIGFIFLRWIFRMAGNGVIEPHPYKLAPGGLGGLSRVLQNLKEGKAKAFKYVLKTPDTQSGEDQK